MSKSRNSARISWLWKKKDKRDPDSSPTPASSSPGSGSSVHSSNATLEIEFGEMASRHGDLKENAASLRLHLLNPKGCSESQIRGGTEVDIVAIHGINGDAFRTWTHKDGNLWLRDNLPSEFPGARIYTFGYNAKVAFSKSTASLDDFSRALLAGLQSKRTSDRLRRRSLVFLCHSMGGIVVKRALTICQLEPEHYGELRAAMKGIIFLGTPHRGSNTVKWPMLVANIAKGMGGSFRNDLLKMLEQNSDALLQVSTDARSCMKNLTLVSFYEVDRIPPLWSVIVDRHSCVLGFPDEKIRPMSGCDHRTICQFDSKDDSNYETIINELHLIVDTPATRELTAEEQECLKSIAFAEMHHRHHDIHRAAEGTCRWILEEKALKDWLHGKNTLLWIRGNPGTGKSTLMKFLQTQIEGMEPASLPDKVIYLKFYFHNRGSELQKSQMGLYRSLIHQLYLKRPQAFEKMTETFKERKTSMGEPGSAWNWHLQELQEHFELSLELVLLHNSIRILIDALDESGAKTARDLVRHFNRYITKSTDATFSLSICYSCRHYPIIPLGNGLEICVDRKNREDIVKFVRQVLHDDASIADLIIDRAQGSFQWARTVTLRALDLKEQYEDRTRIELEIRKLPQELHDLYSQLLNDIPHKEKLM